MKRLLVLMMIGTLLLSSSLTALAAKEVPQPILQADWSVERLAQENNVEVGALLKQLIIADTPENREATLETLHR